MAAAPAWQTGLLLGLGAFLAVIVAPLAPLLGLVFALLGVAALAVLSGDAKRLGAAARRAATLGLALLAGGLLLSFVTNFLAAGALGRGDFAGWARVQWLYLAAEAAVAGGFYLGARHLASARSRALLGVALGAALATSGVAAWQAQAPAQAVVAQGDALADEPGSPGHGNGTRALLAAYFDATAPANGAKAVGFILFAWAYATILGRLRAEARPKDPWAL